MTTQDLVDIKNLYFFHRYIPSSIARLYGVSAKHILEILHGGPNESATVIADLECMICGLEESQSYFIDGNDENQKPQNIIMVCESHKRKFQHLQLRRRRGVLKPQF